MTKEQAMTDELYKEITGKVASSRISSVYYYLVKIDRSAATGPFLLGQVRRWKKDDEEIWERFAGEAWRKIG